MENDNRIYDLLERLYMEMQDMKGNMATKDDIKLLKDDIKLLGVELHGEIQVVYEEIKELQKHAKSPIL